MARKNNLLLNLRLHARRRFSSPSVEIAIVREYTQRISQAYSFFLVLVLWPIGDIFIRTTPLHKTKLKVQIHSCKKLSWPCLPISPVHHLSIDHPLTFNQARQRKQDTTVKNGVEILETKDFK